MNEESEREEHSTRSKEKILYGRWHAHAQTLTLMLNIERAREKERKQAGKGERESDRRVWMRDGFS